MISTGESPAFSSLRRVADIAILITSANAVVLAWQARLPVWGVVGAAAVLLACLVLILALPGIRDAPTTRTRALAGGSELLLRAGWVMGVQYAAYGVLYLPLRSRIGGWPLILNAVIGLLLTGALVTAALIRVMIATRQLRPRDAVWVAALWWIPVAGLVAVVRFRARVLAEYRFAAGAILRDEARRAECICRTRYPIVLVHGIFFRDWRHFNYWGRIPQALQRNGASVYYGGQQSAGSVAASAAELQGAIEAACAASGAGKVNLIAHSKGGLDCRYAISRLGLGDKVASLTTVNTPHWGTVLAESLISKTPDRVAASLGARYDALFARLGDDQPDFLSGISQLTPQACAALNDQLPDDERVAYFSCGSLMRGPSSAPFPLNAGYRLIHPHAGENDGLVDARSMIWGEFLGHQRGTGQQGVSHGDMIDLLRRDIPGFDVCEFYVQLVAALKARGL